jgi:hypothetical protein
MRTIASIVVSMCLVLVIFQSGLAQDPTWEVSTTRGDTLTACLLLSVDDSVLAVTCGGRSKRIPVDSITRLRKVQPSKFWTGVGYGALGGVVIGAAVGLATYSKPEPRPGEWVLIDLGPGFAAAAGALIGLGFGACVGGAIGASISGSEETDLRNTSHAQRLAILHFIVTPGIPPVPESQ